MCKRLFAHVKDIQASHPKWDEFDVTASITGWARFAPAAQWLKKAGLIPGESVTTVVHLDTKQREALFRDFTQREALFREFAAYQRASDTAREQVPLDAKVREALFQEFADYQKTTQ